MSRIVPADAAGIAEAAAALRRGGLAVMPTDTVYGLAARAADPEALTKLYRAKGRDAGKPVAMLVSGVEAVRRAGAALPPAAEKLAAAFWPGALTLVVPSAAPGMWDAFRVPDCAAALALLEAVGEPLAVTSANKSGEAPAKSARAAADALGDWPEILLDAGDLPETNVASTVVKVEGDRLVVLRLGAVTQEMLSRAAGLPAVLAGAVRSC
ncbi:MAG: threonylcarbamoyl-AMP synthase [Kiritimatiellae bacterium]|nr:threonylcarbamoyl-AMP synthase [Kiritimatiellia bacterium]